MPDVTPIRDICEQYELTQAGLAKRFGIPIRTVEQWCTGKRRPPEYVVRMIRTILEHSCRFTFDFDAAMQFKQELAKEVPDVFEKLSVVEIDKFIDLIHDKTILETNKKE